MGPMRNDKMVPVIVVRQTSGSSKVQKNLIFQAMLLNRVHRQANKQICESLWGEECLWISITTEMEDAPDWSKKNG